MTTEPAVAPSSVNPDEFNPFLSMAEEFDRAADHLGLDEGLREVLRMPNRELTVSLPVMMDNGNI